MADDRVLTCVYCGMEYPQDTPSWGNEILTDHIKICPKHPMREAEGKIIKLRAALIGLVGAESIEELNQMEAIVRSASAPNVDKTAIINAIQALRETAEKASATKAVREGK